MNCHDARKFVHSYVDGEFDVRERAEFEAHLKGCHGCRSLARFEDWFRAGLRRAVPAPACPPELRHRVLAKIHASPPPVLRAEQRMTRRLTFVGVPAALTACAGLAFFLLPVTPPDLGAPAADAVEIHRRFLPMEVRSPDDRQVQEWFRPKVDFPVRLPRFAGGGPGGRPRLLGGRLSPVGRHVAAHLMYEMDGAPFSVMVFQDGGSPDSLPTPPGPPRVRMDRVDGYNVASFRRNGVTYTVTGEVDGARMVRMISSQLR